MTAKTRIIINITILYTFIFVTYFIKKEMSGLFSLPDELLLKVIAYLPYDVALRHVCKYLRKLSKPYILYRLNTMYSLEFLENMFFQTYI